MRGTFCTLITLAILLTVLNCVKSAPLKQTKKTASFLLKFGYLEEDNDKVGGALSPNSVAFRASIRRLQRFGNIPVTGKIDAATIKLINTDRCGLKDSSNGVIGRFSLQGTIWKKRDLTYRILNYTRGIPRYTQRRIFRNAFHLWQSSSDLRIREVYSGNADILISFVRQVHGDPYPFDRAGGTLAHAFYPHSNKGLSGDAHFDDDETFTTGTSDGINLDWVAVHEFGHSLGLEHSGVRESIMYPWYKGYIPDIKLSNDDIQGIQALYPKPTARKDLTPATAKATTKTTTSRPRVTTRPDVVTPRPTVPDICSSTIRYDTVFVGPGKWTYFVVGDRFWLVDRALRRYGPWTITTFYKHIKTPVDAAYLNKLGNVVFFKGSKYWEYDSARELKGSGQIWEYGLPSTLENMDAVFTWAKNGKTYFFKDKEYWRYNENSRETEQGYPKNIRKAWRFPDYINAAVKWLNNRTYVFRGRQYLKLQKGKARVERYYPKVIADKWMKCNTKGRGILDSDDP